MKIQIADKFKFQTFTFYTFTVNVIQCLKPVFIFHLDIGQLSLVPVHQDPGERGQQVPSCQRSAAARFRSLAVGRQLAEEQDVIWKCRWRR